VWTILPWRLVEGGLALVLYQIFVLVRLVLVGCAMVLMRGAILTIDIILPVSAYAAGGCVVVGHVEIYQ
jgi:hypothetical protein